MRHIFFFLLIVMLSPISWGADLGKGVDAYERGDYATALREMTPFAEQGNAIAQYGLGLIYANGEGIEKNLTEAMKWYRKAAEQGNANAQNNLGVMYDNGKGVEKNLTEAMKWYRKAAEQGNAIAQNNLGVMYDNGKGVEKNLTEAMKWYRKAAEQGNENALNNLNEKRDFELNTRLRCADASRTAQTEYAAQQVIKACLAKSGFEAESESESDCWFNWFN